MYVIFFANGKRANDITFFPDGGIDRFAKVRSFSSSMSDIDGDREEESEMSDEGTN